MTGYFYSRLNENIGEGEFTIDNKKELKLTAEQKQEFNKLIKIGIIKSLYKKNLLTNEQLNLLIKIQDRAIV